MPIRTACPGSLAVALAASAGASVAAHGHHSVLAFDNERGTEITGKVERVSFANPHTRLVVSVEREDGSRQRWSVESESAALLARLGWDAGMIVAGDRITVIGARARDGSASMRCQRLELEDGRELMCFPLK